MGNTNKYNVLEVKEYLNIFGRSFDSLDGVSADWSGGGIEFRAVCEGEVRIELTARSACRFFIVADGENRREISLAKGRKGYVIASELENGEHFFRFIKSSMVEEESEPLAVTINAIELCGEIVACAPRARFIEFVGDSITCGVGTSSPTVFAPHAELSYGYLVANKLDADYSLVSISGIGLSRSVDRHKGLNMRQAYSYTNYYINDTEKYTPERKADLVVVNLNTNDKGRFGENEKAEFLSDVSDLLSQIKAVHGEDIKILWVFGMMTDFSEDFCDEWTAEYLDSLGGEAAGYYYTVVTKDNRGSADHPIAEAHEKVSCEIVRYIKEKSLI